MVGWIRGRHVRRLIASFQPVIVEHTYGRGRFRVRLADPLALGWYDHDWAELPEISELRHRSLLGGARVFDIGAHQGIVALMLAREVGPAGRVIAVEANPHNSAAAIANRDLNGLTHVEVVQAAVCNRRGTVVFNEGLDGQLDDGSGANGRMAVPGITLDGMAEQFGIPNVVMIDVEGAECLVLSEGRRVLRSGADFAVEVHVGCGLEKLGGSVAEVLSYFPRNRFTLMARREADDHFKPLRDGDSVTDDRFFLLALPNRPDK